MVLDANLKASKKLPKTYCTVKLSEQLNHNVFIFEFNITGFAVQIVFIIKYSVCFQKSAATTGTDMYVARSLDMFVSVRGLTIKSTLSTFVEIEELGKWIIYEINHYASHSQNRFKLILSLRVYSPNLLHHCDSGSLWQIRVRLMVQHNLRRNFGDMAGCVLHLQFCLFSSDSNSFHVSAQFNQHYIYWIRLINENYFQRSLRDC